MRITPHGNRTETTAVPDNKYTLGQRYTADTYTTSELLQINKLFHAKVAVSENDIYM